MPAVPGFAFITRVCVTHGPSRCHGAGRARRRDERRHGARWGMPEQIHHRLTNTDVATSIGAPTMRLLRPDAHTRAQPGDKAGPAIESVNAHWLDADSENRPA